MGAHLQWRDIALSYLYWKAPLKKKLKKRDEKKRAHFTLRIPEKTLIRLAKRKKEEFKG